jgi:hypothetical protein
MLRAAFGRADGRLISGFGFSNPTAREQRRKGAKKDKNVPRFFIFFSAFSQYLAGVTS